MKYIELMKSNIKTQSILISFDEEIDYDILIKLVFFIIWSLTGLKSEKLKKYLQTNLLFLDKKEYLNQNFNSK